LMAHLVKKASVFISGISDDICSPFFDSAGKLHLVFQNSGAIKTINSVGNTQSICSTGGNPSSAVYSPDGVLYVSDFAHAAVLAVQKDSEQELVVGVYEDKPLKGPNCVNITNGDIFFTDSGAFGETGLHSSTGSLFTISNSPSGQILKPISLGNLAYPSGIAVTPDGRFVYVAEMMKNRVLRFFQKPAGVFHGSVFYQMSGSVGPSSLALDSKGNLYIGQYDVRESTMDGTIIVVSNTGKLVSNISTSGPEISGLAINDNMLYITEKSTGTIFRIDCV
jgi:sugar lactone lactonase YvrE